MVWPFSSAKSTNNDPIKELDPSLKEFLEKESPVKYHPSLPPPPPDPSPSLPNTPIHPPNGTSSATPTVPAESLYPDGRYAHLWKTYTPREQVESTYRTDAEKMDDILSAFKRRKTLIGRAALENCSFEHLALYDCWRNGGIKDTMTMCRAENRKFNRCYAMQSKFLKALGYMADWERSKEVEEGIQMHADELYKRMMEQEKMVEEAKAQGLPEPAFEPLLQKKPVTDPFAAARPGNSVPNNAAMTSPAPSASPSSSSSPSAADQAPDSVLSPAARAALRERTKSASQQERELEERVAEQEVMDAAGAFMDVRKLQERAKKERKERRERGEAGLGDHIATFLGW